MDFGAMLNRLVRAARLDVSLYEEVEADTTLTQEALVVVVLIAAINGIVGFIVGLAMGNGIVAALIGLAWGVVWAIVGYFLYAFLAYFICTKLFQATTDFGEMRRVLGYAYGPTIFSLVPCIGWLVALVWTVITGVVAIRQAMDTDTTKAIITAVIAVVIVFIIGAVVGGLIGVGGVGFGAIMDAFQQI